ncbi:MAG: dihydroorotase family protein [Thaumarchaeota archaeon]|nr:dihydroorotase family protein [Nitrososphaerota archaeon]
MEHDLVLEGRVVGPSGVEEKEVGISDGMISEMKKQGLKGARRIRAGRCLIFPGFVDIHTHMREPGWEQKEDFRTGSLAAIHGGVTTVADMPNNPNPATTKATLEEKHRLSKKSLVDVRFFGGVKAAGRDMDAISGLVTGYKLYLARSTGDLLLPKGELSKVMSKVGGIGLPLSLHCEDQTVIDRRTSELAGERRADVHCDVRPPLAETHSVKTVISALQGNRLVRANVCHASTRETLRLVEEGRAAGLKLDCEAALHHLFFNRKATLRNPLLKTNPPLRDDGDRASLVEGVKEGRVSFLVTDHAPHTREEKEELGLSGVPGLDDFAHVVTWLIVTQGVDPATVARVASANPASFLGLEDRGSIGVGKRADFTIVDPGSLEKVRSDDLKTKCGWSPYEGVEFPGRVKWTIRGGEVLLDGYEIVA